MHRTGFCGLSTPPPQTYSIQQRVLNDLLDRGPGFLGVVCQSTQRVAMATFWRTYHHEGKNSPAGWWVHAHPFPPFPLYLQSRTNYKVVVYTLAERAIIYSVVVWFSSSPTPSPSPVSNLSLFLSLPVCRRWSWLTERGGGRRGGAKSCDREKAWPSINHSILSAIYTSHIKTT